MTLKGFKSFANPTTLKLERGITCVVGPNGSGKSNVVDALSWVMGEQGAKSLRGGKMEDVIFAGTSGKSPLGRAEVSLTIDNTDGALPIDFTEVTISRILFRSGQSEYQINGETARLLDIQELLSDSGIGREMHVIVGQGQLDAILSANPEERRGFIEEAAGVLKHRKRKEKALRKLDSMQANMSRVGDLTSELRRQLRPLGKQAEVAKRASTIQADVRDSKLRLLADDIVNLQRDLDAEIADETSLRAKRNEVERELERMRNREIELDQLAAVESPLLSAAQDNFYRLTGEREKLRATQALASERAKYLAEDMEEARLTGRDPEALEAEAAALRQEESQLRIEVEAVKAQLLEVSKELAQLESEFKEEENKITLALQQMADAREATARREGNIGTFESKLASARDERGRLEKSLADANSRKDLLESEFESIEGEAKSSREIKIQHDQEVESEKSFLEKLKAKDDEFQKSLIEIDKSLSAATSKIDALKSAASHKDGAGSLLANPRGLALRGSIASLIEIEKGWELAVSAALGATADAIVVEDLSGALSALSILKSDSSGRAEILIAGNLPKLPAAIISGELTSLASKVKSAKFAELIGSLFSNEVVVESLAQAEAIVEKYPELVVITRDGELLSANLARGGSANSLIEIQSLIEESEDGLQALLNQREIIEKERNLNLVEIDSYQSRYEGALNRLTGSEELLTAIAKKSAGIEQGVKSASDEAARFIQAIVKIEEVIANLQVEFEAVKNDAIEIQIFQEPDRDHLISLENRLKEIRSREINSRLEVRTAEERVIAQMQRAEDLENAAKNERESAARQITRRESRSRHALIAQEIGEAAYEALIQIEVSISQAGAERERLEISRSDREGETLALRAAIRELAGELEILTSSVHKDEIARAEQRLRIEQIEGRVLEEFGLDSDQLINEYGPDNLLPTFIEKEDGEIVPGELIAFKRSEQEKRLASAERSLALLGKINPLALEEYSALEERLKYLADQLEDLKKSKKDLLDIIKEVDDKVLDIFTTAYHDTAREFESIFARLFPGGEGRLILTDPDNMLTTGIDVEARPPGKRIKRLSLLSGGERSLTAVALLVAIFKARPSPFYVLDEVEAALDDTNLGRLLGILAELRSASQLIIITHQKRTMEIADVLYGVTMRGDGVSEVISQRIREVQAPASI
ncbi:MAG: chromosome segregation protein SMC [Actinobacteria bacterium]|nr:chromosome segregation protein SMC [Actinomycetota bacterium]